jgi:uncharacterized protein
MYNPGGDEPGDEWFELYNAGNVAVDMQGWKVGDRQQSHTIASSLIVQPLTYIVFGADDNNTTNGGVIVRYKYPAGFTVGQISLSNSGDNVVVYDQSGAVHDTVSYDVAGFPSVSSSNTTSIQLRNLLSDNAIGTNWCFSTIPWPGSLNGDKGTPGTANNCP